jgi:hypothetical protein
MLLREEGIAEKTKMRLYCCGTAIYRIGGILAYLRARRWLVISIARKWQLSMTEREWQNFFLWRNTQKMRDGKTEKEENTWMILFSYVNNFSV